MSSLTEELKILNRLYYIFVSNLGKKNELHATDMKASFQIVQLCRLIFVRCSCDIVGFAVLWLIRDFDILQHNHYFARVMGPKHAHGKQCRP